MVFWQVTFSVSWQVIFLKLLKTPGLKPFRTSVVKMMCPFRILIWQGKELILILSYYCIDLILTFQPNCFQHTNIFETGLSEIHLLTLSEFKMGFQKLPPKIVNYRDYKNVSRIQSSVFSINVPLLKENILVQLELNLGLRNCTKPL